MHQNSFTILESSSYHHYFRNEHPICTSAKDCDWKSYGLVLQLHTNELINENALCNGWSKWLHFNISIIIISDHKNIKVFISHGGNSGALEAVHFGVPLIGIPLFYDQYRNILSFVKRGVAVLLDMNDLTKDNILSSIKTVIDDKR